jgi:hypothetical protein
VILGVNEAITNAEYHGDTKYLSSSALKLILKSKEEFYRKYILGEKDVPRNVSALNIGTALHLKILEPELFGSEVAVYPGPIRRGADWNKFEAEMGHKTIITLSELDKVNALVAAYNDNPTAVELVKPCLFEHTLCANYEGTALKVRCDGINVERGYIIDVKSTAYASGSEIFKDTIEKLAYDLSGYMYCKVASQIYDKKFDFYFIVVSKSDVQCRVYKMSRATMLTGKAEFESAIETHKKCILTNDWSDDILDSDEQTTDIEEV